MEALDIKYWLVNPPEGWSDEELNDVLHHAQHSIDLLPLQLFLAQHDSPLTMQDFQPKNNPHHNVIIRKWVVFLSLMSHIVYLCFGSFMLNKN